MFAIDGNGDLWAWGDNEYGQLGTGAVSSAVATPTEIGAGIDWVEVEGGWYMTYGRDSAGNVYSWGTDNAGCLGNGAAPSVYSPTLVDTGYRQIAAGKNHFVGIKNDGTLWGWGHNTVGELNGTPTMQTFPIQMSAATDWVDVSIGSYNTTALRSNGVVYYGGDNNLGTGGQGHTTAGAIPFPTPVTVIDDAQELETVTRTKLVVRADGTLWTWGQYDGDDAGTPISGTPRLRNADADWSAVGGDFYGALWGIKPDGELYLFAARWNDPPDNVMDSFQ
jgi:alpha-tubulin suppressor-like RCC1 family protein